MIKTYKSEDARLKLRDILDDVMTGQAESIIERHGKPTAVVISFAQWQAWRRQRSAELVSIRAAMDAGEYVTQEELDARLRADNLF